MNHMLGIHAGDYVLLSFNRIPAHAQAVALETRMKIHAGTETRRRMRDYDDVF
jgi:hypothetical protein